MGQPGWLSFFLRAPKDLPPSVPKSGLSVTLFLVGTSLAASGTYKRRDNANCLNYAVATRPLLEYIQHRPLGLCCYNRKG